MTNFYTAPSECRECSLQTPLSRPKMVTVVLYKSTHRPRCGKD
jgi:hypothetical protein